MIEAQAPGKMILLGEYAVLNGAPALVCAVDRLAKVQIERSANPEYSLYSPALGIPEQSFIVTPKGHVRFDPGMDKFFAKRLAFFQAVFEYCWQALRAKDLRIPSCHINIDTKSFYSEALQSKLGFGSSAALTVSLLYGLYHCSERNIELDRTELFRIALGAHRQAQGNIGSGVDVAASSFGGVSVYRISEQAGTPPNPPQALELWDDLRMLVVWTGKSTSTRMMIHGVDRLKAEQPGQYSRLMSNLEEYSAMGCEAFQSKDLRRFMEAVGKFYGAMQELSDQSSMNIISEAHQTLAGIASRFGAVYKPSGAGSGDIGIAFCESLKQVDELISEFGEAGFGIIDVNIYPDGAGVLIERLKL